MRVATACTESPRSTQRDRKQQRVGIVWFVDVENTVPRRLAGKFCFVLGYPRR